MLNDRKRRLVRLLRETAGAFVLETEGADGRRDSVVLRREVDALLGLWEDGVIDPVAEYGAARPAPASGGMRIHGGASHA